MYQYVVHWDCPVFKSIFKKLDKKSVSHGMRIEVLMVVTMDNIVLWVVILCNMVEI
jgi:hypothetical protein